MEEDLIAPLRLGFCSLVLQANSDTIANFVAWLDLKVAEYKVYGHMILTEADDNEDGGNDWSSMTNDPSPNGHSQPSQFKARVRDRKQHRFQPTAKAFQKNNKPKKNPANGNDRFVGRMGHDIVGQTGIKTENQEPFRTAMNLGVGDFDAGIVNIDTEEENGQLPQVSSDYIDHSELGVSVKHEFDSTQNFMHISTSLPSTTPVQPYQAHSSDNFGMPIANRGNKPVHKMSGGTPAKARSFKPKAFTSPQTRSPLQPKTSSLSSVTGILDTHTVQTEGGYQCKLCSRVIKSPYNAVQHIKEVHLKMVTHRCPVCLTGFNRPFKLANHMRKEHPEVPPE